MFWAAWRSMRLREAIHAPAESPIYQPIQSDTAGGTHIYVAGNFSYANLILMSATVATLPMAKESSSMHFDGSQSGFPKLLVSGRRLRQHRYWQWIKRNRRPTETRPAPTMQASGSTRTRSGATTRRPTRRGSVVRKSPLLPLKMFTLMAISSPPRAQPGVAETQSTPWL